MRIELKKAKTPLLTSHSSLMPNQCITFFPWYLTTIGTHSQQDSKHDISTNQHNKPNQASKIKPANISNKIKQRATRSQSPNQPSHNKPSQTNMAKLQICQAQINQAQIPRGFNQTLDQRQRWRQRSKAS